MAVCASTAEIVMTQDEIRELAKKAGFLTGLKNDNKPFIWHLFVVDDNLFVEMEQFAKLVAEKEREKCAEIAKWHREIAHEIRRRGQA